MTRALRWFLVAISLLNAMVMLSMTQRARLLIINARGGCYPWSPREVPFRQGMTLCPGQSTTVPIEIHIRQPGQNI